VISGRLQGLQVLQGAAVRVHADHDLPAPLRAKNLVEARELRR
jgi:hypothetical protein